MTPPDVYMIRRKSDGLYSTGGTRPSFQKAGKHWRSLANVRKHLCVATYQDTCEIVRYQLWQAQAFALDAAADKVEALRHMLTPHGTALCNTRGNDLEGTSERDKVTCLRCLGILRRGEDEWFG